MDEGFVYTSQRSSLSKGQGGLNECRVPVCEKRGGFVLKCQASGPRFDPDRGAHMSAVWGAALLLIMNRFYIIKAP